jgi:hypothetical protein
MLLTAGEPVVAVQRHGADQRLMGEVPTGSRHRNADLAARTALAHHFSSLLDPHVMAGLILETFWF